MLSLQKFTTEDITKMQEMITEYKTFIDENADIENLPYIDYFGPIYCKKPENFKFFCGDIKMISQLSEYVHQTIKRKGYGHFKAYSQNSKQNVTNNCYVSEEQLQLELFNGVLALLKPYGENVVSLFKIEMATVVIEDSIISGRVRCVICDLEYDTKKTNRKRRQELYAQFWSGNKWCFSNFANHHLNKLHPIKEDTDQAASLPDAALLDNISENSNDRSMI